MITHWITLLRINSSCNTVASTRAWAQRTVTLLSTQWLSHTKSCLQDASNLCSTCALQASQLGVYRAFVDNYKVAVETADKCCQANAQFAEISEVCNHATRGSQVFDVAQLWWQGRFQLSSRGKCHAALNSGADCFNCAAGQWFNEGISSHHSLRCYLPARISRSKAQRTAKTSRLKIHWKVSTDWNEWPAGLYMNQYIYK